MNVAEAVGGTLTRCGVGTVFGVMGSGNFLATNAMVAAGARYVAARHEGGAATMADAYARTSGEVTALSLHQGCGLTNALIAREVGDLDGVAAWLAGPRTAPLLVDAKVTRDQASWWLEEAFRGH